MKFKHIRNFNSVARLSVKQTHKDYRYTHGARVSSVTRNLFFTTFQMLVSWEINTKIGYMGDKVLGGDLVQPR